MFNPMCAETRTWATKRIGEYLIALKAFKKAEPGKFFTLASGKQSEFYIDCRHVVLDNKPAGLIANTILHDMANVVSDWSKVRLLGTGVSGRVMVGSMLGSPALIDKQVQAIIPREVVKTHGTGKEWEGWAPSEGDQLFVVDDVLTTGGTVVGLNQRIATWFPGARIQRLFVIVDRQEGGRENLAVEGIETQALLTLDELNRLNGGVNEPAKENAERTTGPASSAGEPWDGSRSHGER